MRCLCKQRREIAELTILHSCDCDEHGKYFMTLCLQTYPIRKEKNIIKVFYTRYKEKMR